MSPFEDAVNAHWDARISIFGAIKARSVDADTLVLSALTVLAYAQLEGGVKDLSACVIRQINRLKLEWGEVSPGLLEWRNKADLNKFRAAINFAMVGVGNPFTPLLIKRAQIKPINRHLELNQMRWTALKTVYQGFSLNPKNIEHFADDIDSLVGARNDAAHRGIPPNTAAHLLERQVRQHASTVESAITDLALQLLPYFKNSLHRR